MAACGEFPAAGTKTTGRAAVFPLAQQLGGQGAGGRAFTNAFWPGEKIAVRQPCTVQGTLEQSQGFVLADDLGKGHIKYYCSSTAADGVFPFGKPRHPERI